MSIPLPADGHEPVLADQTLHILNPQAGQIAVDCTLGRAGHARLLAQRLGPDGLLIGLDVDPHNLEFAQKSLEDAPCPVRLFHANFAELPEVLRQVGRGPADLLLADLGLSTNQLFDQRYGLSFAEPMPLDMRIDPRIEKTAADWVNTLEENDLANVLYNNAQERYSRRIARNITLERRISPIKTTERLARIVRQSIPSRGGPPERIDPATRSFLALRMRVNSEMENLTALLACLAESLAANGRAAIISFQSMEDRLVKQAFGRMRENVIGQLLTKKPLGPSEDELRRNPRSRSAKLRGLLKNP